MRTWHILRVAHRNEGFRTPIGLCDTARELCVPDSVWRGSNRVPWRLQSRDGRTPTHCYVAAMRHGYSSSANVVLRLGRSAM